MVLLIFLMLMMLVSSILFCHALEHLGKYLNFSTGFTASVLIGVGTASPELLVPIVAIGTHHNDIGVGAVLGSSLMLLTVAFPLCGIFTIWKRGRKDIISPEALGTSLDFKYILYGILLLLVVNISQHYFMHNLLNCLFVLLMVICYICYLYKGFKLSKQHNQNSVDLHYPSDLLIRILFSYASRFFYRRLETKYPETKEHILLILLQLLSSFIAMFYSTEYLIHDIESKAVIYGISAFILSMLITPIVTELPEKVNSVSYILKRKDTLAIGNITGALVLQTILLPVLPTIYGLWAGDQYIMINLSCISGSYLWLFFWFKLQKHWKTWQLIPPILLYFANIYFCFFN